MSVTWMVSVVVELERKYCEKACEGSFCRSQYRGLWGKGCHLSRCLLGSVREQFSVFRCCVWLKLFHELSEIPEALAQGCLLRELGKGPSDNPVCLGQTSLGQKKVVVSPSVLLFPSPRTIPCTAQACPHRCVCTSTVLLVVGPSKDVDRDPRMAWNPLRNESCFM